MGINWVFIVLPHRLPALSKTTHPNITRLYLIKIAKWFMLYMPIVVPFYESNGLTMKDIMLLQAIYSIAIVIAKATGSIALIYSTGRFAVGLEKNGASTVIETAGTICRRFAEIGNAIYISIGTIGSVAHIGTALISTIRGTQNITSKV